MARKPTNPPRADSVVVVGLGRFGGALAQEMQALGHEVLGVDNDSQLVEQWSDILEYVVQADSTDTEALRQLGVAEFPRAVVGIGTDIEASVLTVLALEEVGVPEIWAKAITKKHGEILKRTGAHHVVFPEADMGQRVAHLVSGKVLDYVEFDTDFVMVKTKAPASVVGMTLGDSSLRTRHGITVVAVKQIDGRFEYATPATRITKSDELVVAGRPKSVERFAALPAEKLED